MGSAVWRFCQRCAGDLLISSSRRGEPSGCGCRGLVMLLPHGYEGQGPEHSSARLERYLQLCAKTTCRFATAPRRPTTSMSCAGKCIVNSVSLLVLMTPKSLLRHKRAVSKLEKWATAPRFHRVLWDEGRSWCRQQNPRVVLCSGKVYYDLPKSAKSAASRMFIFCVLSSFTRIPEKALKRTQAVPERAHRLVPRRAQKHGQLDVHPRAVGRSLVERSAFNRAALCRSCCSCSPCDGSCTKHLPSKPHWLTTLDRTTGRSDVRPQAATQKPRRPKGNRKKGGTC